MGVDSQPFCRSTFCRHSNRLGRFKPATEVLQGSCGVRGLVGSEHDALGGKVGLELTTKLESFFRQALGGDFEHASAIGIEPHLDHDRAVKVLRLVLGLEQEGGSQDDQLVHGDPCRRVCIKEGALFFGEQLAQWHLARGHVEHFLPGANAFERSGTNESARHHIHLDLERG